MGRFGNQACRRHLSVLQGLAIQRLGKLVPSGLSGWSINTCLGQQGQHLAHLAHGGALHI